MKRPRLGGSLSLVLPGLLLVGCSLTEVSIPQGEDVAVVEAVLNTGQPVQRLLLHRTVENGEARALVADSVLLTGPDGRARRYVRTLNETSGCLADADSIPAESVSCYVLEFSPAPGAVYALDVFFDGDQRIRGRTQVPGTFELRGSPAVRAGSCVLRPGTQLALAWTRAPGVWSYLADLEIRGLRRVPELSEMQQIPDPLNLFGLAISDSDTTLSVPADFGLFQAGEVELDLLRLLQNGLPAGITAGLTIAAADRNLVNAIRGGTFNPSGLVRISSVAGDGIGLFGSVVPRTLRIEVRADSSGSSC